MATRAGGPRSTYARTCAMERSARTRPARSTAREDGTPEGQQTPLAHAAKRSLAIPAGVPISDAATANPHNRSMTAGPRPAEACFECVEERDRTVGPPLDRRIVQLQDVPRQRFSLRQRAVHDDRAQDRRQAAAARLFDRQRPL